MSLERLLLGRGTVTGRLHYADDQTPVVGGTVTVTSTLFQEAKTLNVDAAGAFRIGGMPVGPLTLTGRDPAGNRVRPGIDEARHP